MDSATVESGTRTIPRCGGGEEGAISQPGVAFRPRALHSAKSMRVKSIPSTSKSNVSTPLLPVATSGIIYGMRISTTLYAFLQSVYSDPLHRVVCINNLREKYCCGAIWYNRHAARGPMRNQLLSFSCRWISVFAFQRAAGQAAQTRSMFCFSEWMRFEAKSLVLVLIDNDCERIIGE